jgi:hypothetical protein
MLDELPSKAYTWPTACGVAKEHNDYVYELYVMRYTI